jgi:hypothetical protein
MLLVVFDVKKCSKCQISKPLSDFHKHKSNKDGLQFQCKSCRVQGCAKYFQSISDEKKEERKAKTQSWREKNRSLTRSYASEYKLKNRPTYTANQIKRHVGKKNRTPNWLTEFDLLKINCYYQLAAMRSRESGEKWHVDHIIPLHGKIVSGLHVPNNLRVITATENERKRNYYEV